MEIFLIIAVIGTIMLAIMFAMFSVLDERFDRLSRDIDRLSEKDHWRERSLCDHDEMLKEVVAWIRRGRDDGK